MKKKITVGQLAKQGQVSTRTIQYYDSIDLLKPSEVSESGRRLYEESDIAILHQIVTLKSMGLSLNEIRDRLSPVESQEDIYNLLGKQALIIKERISKEKKLLESIDMLRRDIDTSNSVNWAKYAQILSLINENNENYWVLKFLDEGILSKMTEIHEEDKELSTKWLEKLLERSAYLKEHGYSPESDAGQKLAEKWWGFVQKYTGGDLELLSQLEKFYKTAEDWPSHIKDLHETSSHYLEKCIVIFLDKHSIRIEGMTK